MYGWSTAFYGNLPYIFGYATSGANVSIVAIDRRMKIHNLIALENLSNSAGQARILMAFYNMAHLFNIMSKFGVPRHRQSVRAMQSVKRSKGDPDIKFKDNQIKLKYCKSREVPAEHYQRNLRHTRQRELIRPKLPSTSGQHFFPDIFRLIFHSKAESTRRACGSNNRTRNVQVLRLYFHCTEYLAPSWFFPTNVTWDSIVYVQSDGYSC